MTATLKNSEKMLRNFAVLQAQLGASAAMAYLCLVRQRIHNPAGFTSRLGSAEFDRLVTAGPASDKVEKLAQFLDTNMTTQSSAIIFVEQRVVTIMLCHLLRTLTSTSRFAAASFVGTAGRTQHRTDVSDIVSGLDQQHTLQDFRAGQTRVLVCTSVAEEGLDIRSCNVVVRFDLPQNLKAYIQSRGRARMQASQFVMLVDGDDPGSKIQMWRIAEQEMIRLMTIQQLQREDLWRIEHDDSAEDGLSYAVGSTGAKLTLDRAPQYLRHFCSQYRLDTYTSTDPIYGYIADSRDFFQGTVELPGGLDESLRCHSGKKFWSSERSARRDAAFQAMIKLHTVGLVNDHLLPAPVVDSDWSSRIPVVTSARLDVPAQFDPWLDNHVPLDLDRVSVGQLEITLSRPGLDALTLHCVSTAFPPTSAAMRHTTSPKSCNLYWETTDIWSASFHHVELTRPWHDSFYEVARTSTRMLLNGATTKPVLDETDISAFLLVASRETNAILSWISDNEGSTAATDAYVQQRSYAIVRYDDDFHRARIIRDWPSPGIITSDPLPRRRNFLVDTQKLDSRVQATGHIPKHGKCKEDLASEQRSTVGATIDKFHMDNVCWSMILPSILHHLTHEAIAGRLYGVLFRPLGLEASPLIREAITAPSASILPNYQRLEFIGDSVLKFAVTLDLFLRYPYWHEGYLTMYRARSVSNARLTQVAMDKEISQYIMTAPFAARRWKAACLPHAGQTAHCQGRQLSSKVLADVVEAILGAVFVHSGLEDTFTMIASFLPEFDPSVCHAARLDQAQPTTKHAHNIHVTDTLQDLVGHVFHRPTLLIQAVTHPTASHITRVVSYQRLEYLGDAVLDLLITEKLAQHKATLSHVRMHLIKSTLANAHILAFWCMSLAIDGDDFHVVYRDTTDSFEAVSRIRTVCLAQCLRFHHDDIGPALEACSSRFRNVQDEVTNALQAGVFHPWTLLTSINAPKFVSDMVESVLGAIFLDVQGDLRSCRRFLDLLGLTAYLDRLIIEPVELHHPKTLLSMRTSSKIIYQIDAPDDRSDTHRCTVEIDSTHYVTVTNGVSREHVITKAAEEVLRRL